MTALVAMRAARSALDRHRRPRRSRACRRSREGLRPGERVEAWKLLYGLLLYSGNDDALALAIGRGRDALAVRRADEREGARRSACRDTHFRSPSGLLDRDNYSTAWDMAALDPLRPLEPALPRDRAHAVKHVPWSPPTGEKIYVNKNHLLGAYPGADGVKTGWTTIAKHCLVASAHRNGVHLIAVMLGSDDSYKDVKKLLDLASRSQGLTALLRVRLLGLVHRLGAVPLPAVDARAPRPRGRRR